MKQLQIQLHEKTVNKTETLYRNTWKYQLKVTIVKVKYRTQSIMLSSLKPKSIDGPVAQREITIYASPPTKLSPPRMPDVKFSK